MMMHCKRCNVNIYIDVCICFCFFPCKHIQTNNTAKHTQTQAAALRAMMWWKKMMERRIREEDEGRRGGCNDCALCAISNILIFFLAVLNGRAYQTRFKFEQPMSALLVMICVNAVICRLFNPLRRGHSRMIVYLRCRFKRGLMLT